MSGLHVVMKGLHEISLYDVHFVIVVLEWFRVQLEMYREDGFFKKVAH